MFGRIAIRLTATNVVVVATVVVALLAATFLSVRATLQNTADKDLRIAAERFAVTTAAGSSIEDPASDLTKPRPPFPKESSPAGRRGMLFFASDLDGNVSYPEDWEAGTALDPAALEGALNGTEAVVTVSSGEERYRVLTRPVYSEGTVVGAIQVAESREVQLGLISTLGRTLIIVGAAGIAIAAIAGYLLANRALRPVRAAFDRQRAFIADASHELRTPVAVVQADADALSRTLTDLSPDDSDLLADLQHESEYIDQVISRLLEMARLDSAQRAVTTESVDVAALGEELARGIRRIANPSGVTVQTEFGEKPLNVNADPIRLRLVLLSLLDNAVKYNREGGTVTLTARSGRGATIMEIRDTGIGIPKDDLSRVFDRFYRVDKSRSRAAGGVGLGLAIAKQAVESIGGSLILTSAPDEGTTATVRLRPWEI